MADFENGVRVLQRNEYKSDSDYIDAIENEYNNLCEKYVSRDGACHSLFKILTDYADSHGEEYTSRFRAAMTLFHPNNITKAIEIAKNTGVTIVPDKYHFDALYNVYEKLCQTEYSIRCCVDEFLTALKCILIRLNLMYQNLPSRSLENGYLLFTKKENMSDEDFGDSVCDKYKDFIEDFLNENGPYFDLFKKIHDYSNSNGLFSTMLFKTNFPRFVKNLDKIKTIITEEKVAVIPDTKYFRSLYFNFFDSDMSEEKLEKVTDDFNKAISTLSEKIELNYDLLQDETTHNASHY